VYKFALPAPFATASWWRHELNLAYLRDYY
jgi:hypothetical protein